MKKILVIDGNSIPNRAFYGVRPLSTHTGIPTNAVFGAVNIITRQLDALKPDYVAIAFDLKEPAFRHKLYDAYKAGRRPTPDDLRAQFPHFKEVLRAMGLHVLELPGYEADDIQGTIASFTNLISDSHAYILSGDRDLFQLIGDRTTVLYAGSETVAFDRAKFGEKYEGITPEQFVDLKALMGDSSDNIPGVAGVGEKTAMKLMTSFGSLDGIYEHIDDPSIAKGVREKLQNSRENAYLSQELARIMTDVPLGLTPEDIAWHGFRRGALYKKLTELELTQFITRFRLSAKDAEEEPAADAAEQPEDTVSAEASAESTAACTYEEADAAKASTMSGKFAFHMNLDGVFLSNGKDSFHYTGALEDLAPLFTEGNEIICYDGKNLLHKLHNCKISTGARFLDVMLYAYVLDSSAGTTTLANLAGAFLGEVIDDTTPAAHVLYRLESLLSSKVEEIHCTKLLNEIEIPLLPILAEMEEHGFLIDREGLEEYGDYLRSEADKAMARIEEMVGHTFNLNSPKQLGVVLYEELGLPSPKKKSGSYPTDADTLEKLRPMHPIIDEILSYRHLTKLHSTYAVGLLAAADSHGRIHTDFKQALTATGRLSSAEPNLQNIPIRTPLGRQMRKYFIPAEGCLLVDADYSQIELRLLAVLSGDTAMTEAFRSGADIHTATAASAFRVSPEEVTPELRKSAKAINFGIVYGISAFSLSNDLGISVGEAKQYIESYMQTYPSIGTYLDETIAHATEVGYTETLYLRRRYIRELSASNGAVRAFGRRIAMNAPLQGTAADVMKLAMVRVYHALKQELPSARLIMQVHDELVVECPAADAPRAAEILKREMEGVTSFAVPLTADVQIGENWLK